MLDWSVSTWIGAVLGLLLAIADEKHTRYFAVSVWRFTWGYDKRKDDHG